jgi:tetratricopeptide (TPR) repeat protein
MRGDLDWVVMKALEKDRTRRYETANGLARDIRRYLDGDPVEAGPPSGLYRLKKFAGKHRAGLAVAAAALLALVVAVSALAVSTALIARSRSEALRELARVRAERRELAHVYFRENALVGRALGDIKDNAFDPGSWRDREFELVDQAVQFQEMFARQLLSDSDLRYEAAFCYYKSGDNEVGLSARDPSQEGRRRRIEHAIASQRRASELFAQLHAESPERRDYREALQSSISHLGLILFVQGRGPEAEEALRRALALDDPSAGESAPPGWKGLPAGRTYTARGLVYLARLVEERDPREAEVILRRGLAHTEEWLRETPDDRQIRRELEEGRYGRIRALRRLGEQDKLRAMLSELSRRELSHPGLCNAVAWWLATAEDERCRDPARAVVLARKATAQAPGMAAGWNTLGVALYRAGAWDEAIQGLTRSMELTRGDSPTDWLFLAMAHWQKGDRAEARTWYRRAVEWLDRNRSDDGELARFRAEADALIRSGRHDRPMANGPNAFAR